MVSTYNPKIAVMAPIYRYYPVIIGSMLAQKHQNWEFSLIHDGPEDSNNLAIQHAFQTPDPRIRCYATEKRVDKWGHPLRRQWLKDIKPCNDIDLVVITNADNYHNPVYLERLCKPFSDKKVVATYAEFNSTHHHSYGIFTNKLACSAIDIAALMFRKDAACEIGWQSDEYFADWVFIDSIMKKYGKDNFRKVDGHLFTHN